MAHNPLTSFFASEQSSTLVCTSAGVIGGTIKAVSTPHLLDITFDCSFTVATYAALSDIAAYVAKETIGWAHRRVLIILAKRKGGASE